MGVSRNGEAVGGCRGAVEVTSKRVYQSAGAFFSNTAIGKRNIADIVMTGSRPNDNCAGGDLQYSWLYRNVAFGRTSERAWMYAISNSQIIVTGKN